MADKKKTMIRSVRQFALIAASFGLVGCNQALVPDMTSTGSIFGPAKNSAFKHTITQKRPLQEAFLHLPPSAGQMLNVTQSYHGNGVEQLIIFEGDFDTRGENAARVRMVTTKLFATKSAENISILPTSARQIRRELARVLPGVRMRISNRLHANAYGPFSYALGRAAGNVNCIYGWQNLNGSANDRWAPLRGKSAKPKLSVRLRVCRTGFSNRQLVDLMRNLRIEADPAQALRPTAVSWNAGTVTNLTTAMPQYEAGGYVSNQLEPVAPEYIEPKPKRVQAKRVAKKPRKRTVLSKPVAVKKTNNSVYRPPLPGTQPRIEPTNATLIIVPKPQQTGVTAVQNIKPTVPPANTVVSYAPPTSQNLQPTSGQVVVPLPN